MSDLWADVPAAERAAVERAIATYHREPVSGTAQHSVRRAMHAVLAEAGIFLPVVPDWVADLLNRRTAVEAVLRAPTVAIDKGLPLVPALTAEQMWELANKLSVPADFGSKS